MGVVTAVDVRVSQDSVGPVSIDEVTPTVARPELRGRRPGLFYRPMVGDVPVFRTIVIVLFRRAAMGTMGPETETEAESVGTRAQNGMFDFDGGHWEE